MAAARRLKPHKDHSCIVPAAFEGRGVIELRWLPKRQMYSLWVCLEKMVYADIKPHMLDFAAGVDSLLTDVEAAKNAPPGARPG